ncbi:coxsackievirus and adenovirus receptor isoform X2 [Pantherophis guttatus]|uniref:Coxsackievirus and adenovirus receptor isoform X2 n=1 Tax=Pantherophis guttatus TaxID=94885 RepID=A0A6P9C8L3_PANGU|nr:coxsackievirus and adenovirus receptor isoform X2 [Pantherophis guttatus]
MASLLPLLWAATFLCADLIEGVTITSTEQTTVTKAQGDKVTLLCTFTLATADTSADEVEWSILPPQGEEPVIIYNEGKLYDKYAMMGRVQFAKQNPTSGNASIDILNLKPEDTGTYQCKVRKLPSIKTHRVHLIVLEKPMKTKCHIEGSQEIGSDLTLKCKSQEGSPIIVYSWEKITGSQELPATALPNENTGDLFVKNASQTYSGTYTCLAYNKVGRDECSVILSIVPPIDRAGTIAGAVIGTLLALSLMAFIIFCCYKKRRDTKYEKEVHHDIREDVPPPKSRASTARSYIGSNRSSLGSMSPSNMDGFTKTQYNKVPSEDFERTPSQNQYFDPPKVAAPNLSRMGAIPVMIPAQSKDGSIV